MEEWFCDFVLSKWFGLIMALFLTFIVFSPVVWITYHGGKNREACAKHCTKGKPNYDLDLPSKYMCSCTLDKGKIETGSFKYTWRLETPRVQLNKE